MPRTLADIRRRVREELRAEGPDGGGYSDFFLDQQINSAIGVLSGIYPIRDTFTFTTTEGQNEYDLDVVVGDDMDVDKIVRLTYDGFDVPASNFRDHFATYIRSGVVRGWTLWGRKITFHGDVEEGTEVKIWVTRMPKRVSDPEDEPELPPHADEAIVHFVIAACYRESRDYDRATQHYRNFLHHEERLRSRDIPQGQRNVPTMMSSFYSPPLTGLGGRPRSTPEDGDPE